MGGSSSRSVFFKKGDSFIMQMGSVNYHEGSVINGSISYNQTHPMPPCDISIVVEGTEYVKWKKLVTKTRGRGKDRRTTKTWKTLSKTEKFIENKIPCMKVSEASNPGFKEYPFSITLPTNIPGSYVQKQDNIMSNDRDFA